jgi:hypothetical protein
MYTESSTMSDSEQIFIKYDLSRILNIKYQMYWEMCSNKRKRDISDDDDDDSTTKSKKIKLI